jgi:hypothetical protein
MIQKQYNGTKTMLWIWYKTILCYKNDTMVQKYYYGIKTILWNKYNTMVQKLYMVQNNTMEQKQCYGYGTKQYYVTKMMICYKNITMVQK